MSELRFQYGGKEYGVGDEIELYMHLSSEKATYMARSDEGVVIFPIYGSRMIGEMIVGGWKIVNVRARVARIIKKNNKCTIIVKPLEWRGIYK